MNICTNRLSIDFIVGNLYLIKTIKNEEESAGDTEYLVMYCQVAPNIYRFIRIHSGNRVWDTNYNKSLTLSIEDVTHLYCLTKGD